MARNQLSPILATLLFGIVSTSSMAQSSETLRIGTWNIANLHHESGVSLRGSALARDDLDYARLAEVAAVLDLDVVALQEVGSPAAIARIFPADEYHAIISDRYVKGAEEQPAGQRDIYTALVFSKDSFPEAPNVTTMDALSIQHIGFDRDGTPSSRPTRAGVMVDIELGGETVRLLGVHLKSSCHRWSLDPIQDQNNDGRFFRSRFDCRTLDAQLNILENWIEQQSAQGIPTIVLGDFNRDMNAENADGDSIDPFWMQLNDGTPGGLELAKGPLGIDEVCWPRHGDRFDDHIDFVIYDQALSGLATLVEPQKFSMGHEDDPRYATIPDPNNPDWDIRQNQRLSDHCPVVMEIRK
ncbi:endonuclease/exonuclease/phosphatase family protein [Phaeobacter sp.]|uniref:endonuclease/exonuclease/phosphatase family protein n=1 Tax=Phaeobacter sp. TaxID=1902409 RepID=UPI0025F8F0AC|nr:endonuclease/exonuclease/phosphatase family protein [Phaeobacter sp.]